MLGLYDQQAMMWYGAEKQDGQIAWADLPIKRRDTIRDRVKRVLAGEVTRSMCSPGDLVVLEGRYRIGSRMEPPKDEFPYENEIKEIRWGHLYDSLVFGGSSQMSASTRVFSNANVGFLHLTNLMIAGALPCDHSWANRYLYATVAGFDESDEPLVRRMLEHCMVAYDVHDRWVVQHTAWDLFTEPRLSTFMLAPRTSFGAVCVFGRDQAYQKLNEKALKTDRERARPTLVIHMEGWERRSVY